MANCTNVGQPGTNISLADNPLPGGVLVALSGYSQSANSQTAVVKDQNGKTVASISSTGNPAGNPQSMGLATFKTPNTAGPYTVTISNGGSQTSQVIKGYSTLSSGTSTYLGTWQFISEDTPNGGDCDFNDSTVYLSWNLRAG